MMHRVLWLLAGLATMVGVAVWFDRSLDLINPATFQRIKLGMTLDEVEAILGRPPEETQNIGVRHMPWHKPEEQTWRFWSGNSYRIQLGFNEDDKMISADLIMLPHPRPSIPDRIRAWLKSQ
jgi:hypothetical protein